MSRLKRFTHSLASGYLSLGVNVVYTLASVPLALYYLSRAEFGLWAVVMQLALNLQLLVDLGMSGAVSRILIDHKDEKTATGYGTVIQTGVLAMLVQGGLVALIGGVASLWLPQWMNVAPEFWRVFRVLMLWQCAFLGMSFAVRIFPFILQAHQRYDILNYACVGGFVVNLLALWAGFHWNLGLFSMLVASAANLIFFNLYCLIAVWHLRLLPARGCWGRASYRAFREIFSYANNLFLMSVGQVLISVSQVPVIGALLGMEAAAVWSVATKVFMLAQQMITRIFEFSVAAFAEMMVRGERERLQSRFRDMTALTAATGGLVCLMVAVCNRGFLALWTHHRIAWAGQNDLLMALFIIVGAITRCHIGLAGQTKQIRAMKYIYLVEGGVFIVLSLALAQWLGLAGIILGGMVSNLLCSGLYGLHRTTGYFQISAREVLGVWLAAPARMFLMVLAAAGALWFATRNLQPVAQFVVNAAALGLVGGWCFWKIGLTESLRNEVAGLMGKARLKFSGAA